MSKKLKLVGKEFGHLTVIKENGHSYHLGKKQHIMWECLCKCGNTKTVNGGSLISGRSSSCGCQVNLRGNKSSRWKGEGEISSCFWGQIVMNAKHRGFPIEIDIKYAWQLFLKQYRKCALSDLPLKFKIYARDNSQTASLDRIDSLMGYIEGNVQWVHKDVNYMKQEYNQEYFIDICKKITNNQKTEVENVGVIKHNGN